MYILMVTKVIAPSATRQKPLIQLQARTSQIFINVIRSGWPKRRSSETAPLLGQIGGRHMMNADTISHGAIAILFSIIIQLNCAA